MQNPFQRVHSKRRKQHMHVIRHYAPCEQPVALPMKLPDCIRHNFGDAKVAQIAFAQPVVQKSFCFLQERAQFAALGAIRGSAGLSCSSNCLAFPAQPFQQLARQRVRQSKRNKVDGKLALPMRQVSTRPDCGRQFHAQVPRNAGILAAAFLPGDLYLGTKSSSREDGIDDSRVIVLVR